MDWKRSGVAVLAVAASVAACGDSTGVGNVPEVVDLAGTWNATVVEFTNQANASEKIDLIAEGATIVLTIMANGDYALTVDEPMEAPSVEVGTITIDGNTLTLSGTGESSADAFTFNLSGNTLTLTTDDDEFDFDDDGTEEPASLRAVFQSSDVGTGVAVVDLAGTWNATVVEFTNQANTTEKVDLIVEGATIVLTIMANGDYTLTVDEPMEAQSVEEGTIAINGNTLTLSETGQTSVEVFAFSLSGNTLTLTTGDDEFDFDDNGTEEPASLRAVFQKQ